MKDIDKILETASMEEVEIPQKIQYRVRYTLKNKARNKKHPIMKKLVMTMASLLVVSIGSIGVYAVNGGTIAGKPITEWLVIKFSDEYENYKVNVEGQELIDKETSIDLTSTVCDDGFTILEFDVKLSKEDKEKLKIGEPILTEEYINSTDESIQEEKERVISEYSDKTIDSIYISFNNKLITDETGTYLEGLNNYSITIDGKDFWIRPRSVQTTTKISDYEYKVYQMYFLTDKELGTKQEFTITLGDIVIEASDTQINEKQVYVPINGEFNIKVSKEKAVENTKIIEPECEEIKYKDMTKKVEKVMITPLQTIVKISTVYENLNLEKLTDTENENHINIIEYEASDEDGKNLSVFSYETKRTVTYADGRVEEWEQGDIGTSKEFDNGKMELTEYVIIEKKEDSPNIKIKLKERIETENVREYIPIGNFNINLEEPTE